MRSLGIHYYFNIVVNPTTRGAVHPNLSILTNLALPSDPKDGWVRSYAGRRILPCLRLRRLDESAGHGWLGACGPGGAVGLLLRTPYKYSV